MVSSRDLFQRLDRWPPPIGDQVGSRRRVITWYGIYLPTCMVHFCMVVNLKVHMDVSLNGGTPKSSVFNRFFLYKPSILGYRYFWKPPYTIPMGCYDLSGKTLQFCRIFCFPANSKSTGFSKECIVWLFVQVGWIELWSPSWGWGDVLWMFKMVGVGIDGICYR